MSVSLSTTVIETVCPPVVLAQLLGDDVPEKDTCTLDPLVGVPY